MQQLHLIAQAETRESVPPAKDWHNAQAARRQREDRERLRKTIARVIFWLLATGAFLTLYAASWLLVPPLAG